MSRGMQITIKRKHSMRKFHILCVNIGQYDTHGKFYVTGMSWCSISTCNTQLYKIRRIRTMKKWCKRIPNQRIRYMKPFPPVKYSPLYMQYLLDQSLYQSKNQNYISYHLNQFWCIMFIVPTQIVHNPRKLLTNASL